MTRIRPARTARDPTDAEVDAVVDLYPDGAPLPVIAEVLGIHPERARQIVANSLAKALQLFRENNRHAEWFLPDDRDSTEQGVAGKSDSWDESH